MVTLEKHKPTAKVWLEYKGEPILGEGGATILEAVEKEKSISNAAIKIGMSYRYVWNYLAKMRKALDEPIVETFKGGKAGGGGAKVKMEISLPATITALISTEAVEDLNIKVGDKVEAVIKSTEVMVAKER